MKWKHTILIFSMILIAGLAVSCGKQEAVETKVTEEQESLVKDNEAAKEEITEAETAEETETAAAAEQETVSAETEEASGSKLILPMQDSVQLAQPADGIYSAAFQIEDIVLETDSDMKEAVLHFDLFVYDRYVPEDIMELKEEDTIQIAGNDVQVESVEFTENTFQTEKDVKLNGGYEMGGYDLRYFAEENTQFYRIIRENDYPLYINLGETSLPVSADARFTDYAMDNEGVTVEIGELAAYLEDTWPYDCTELNILITVEDGQITDIVRRYTP